MSTAEAGEYRAALDLCLRLETGRPSKSYVEAVIDDYFEELARNWASSDFLTVRISQIESRILSECSSMITDIGGTKIDGKESNLALGPDSIPPEGGHQMDRGSLTTCPRCSREVLEFQTINAANEPEISVAWDAAGTGAGQPIPEHR
ncbi:MAG: hypothetical protein ACLU9S_20450 [Oscillospiraceae bacterium]